MLRRSGPVFVLLAAIIVVTGCDPCNRSGMTISAEAKETTIGTPRSFVEVFGSHFSPNAPMTISFGNIPAANSAQSQFQGAAVADSGGAFRWTTDISAFGPLDFSSDPSVDVWITAKETNGGCFATTSIKAGTILHPPLR